MKSLKNVLLAGLLIAPSAAAQTVVTAGGSTAPWLGFMNVWELNCTTFVFNSGWGVPDLRVSFDDMAGTITMTPATINDPASFWYQGAGATPGMPGAPGNKCMEALAYVQVDDDSLAGQNVIFSGTVISNTLTGPHIAEIFIRDFAPDFSFFNQNSIPVVPGPFSFSLTTDPGLGRHVQYGIRMVGPNAWPGDEVAFGNIVLGTGLPAGVFTEFCDGDGGDQMGCTNCPCGNNAPVGTIGGCLNSALTSARLMGSGTPNVSGDTTRFEVTSANPATFGILTSADNLLPNMGACPAGSGVQSALLDGLRCIGGSLQRHGSRATDANGDIGISNNGWGPPNGPAGGLIASGGFIAGQTRQFQCFYRESATLGCLSGQNTSNAVSVTFQP